MNLVVNKRKYIQANIAKLTLSINTLVIYILESTNRVINWAVLS